MDINNLGYNPVFEQFRIDNGLTGFAVGRVIAEHKERYTVGTGSTELDAEITGNLRFSAAGREDFPAVGDWVALTVYGPDFGIIHHVFPRFSIISRQAVGHAGEIQVIATNVDSAFLVQAVDRDFNINRLERYLTICHSAKVQPIVVLTKTDLVDSIALSEIKESIAQRIPTIPVITVSNATHEGLDRVQQLIKKGKTYCMLGSSGVGKSTLINNLRGENVMQTDLISTSTGKGRHVTTHRELVVLEGGGILIDNPGMREVGVTDVADGLSATFDSIFEHAKACKYHDCSHTTEAGCAVIDAVRNGQIDQKSYENYLKMNKEKDFFESSATERRKRDKDFGKMLKNYKKGKPNY